VEWLIVGVMRLWRIVGAIKVVGHMYEGRFLRLCESDRFVEVKGVRMSLG
jgi:hypothetical protein